jgi:hypothetical protein
MKQHLKNKELQTKKKELQRLKSKKHLPEKSERLSKLTVKLVKKRETSGSKKQKPGEMRWRRSTTIVSRNLSSMNSRQV